MMINIVEINSTNYASTGNIMNNIAFNIDSDDYKVYTACKNSKESRKHLKDNQILFGIPFERVLTSYLTHITGLRDHFNYLGTYLFIKKLKKINPNLIHLHVLHDDFINIKMLFKYIKTNNIPVIWTFHDCSAMTGQCPYFDMVNCDKWIDGCYDCPQIHGDVDSLFFDTSKYIWIYRKKIFTSLNDLTIVTPSKWLSSLVKKSFFRYYDVKVINNGINLSTFKYRDNSFKKDYSIDNKYLVLGIANVWSKRKGLDVFVELAKGLPNNYQIVLVGTNDEIDKVLPSNIISIHRTYNQEELVNIYSSADVFVNPTREENFPTVNIESLACGTPVITFKTGGSPEILDKTCGIVVEKDDIESMKKSIIKVCEEKPFNIEDCIKRSKLYDCNTKFKEYIELYKDKAK